MTYIFGEKSKYQGKTIEQVALADYLHLMFLLEYPYSGENLKKNIHDLSEKLNNFVPIGSCKACGRDSEYFPMEIIVGKGYDRFGNEEIKPLDYVADLSDLRCGEHNKNPRQKGLTYSPINFDLLKCHSREPKWVIEKINNSLLELAAFSGSKTRKNCEEFFKNLKQRPAIQTPKPVIEKIQYLPPKSSQQPELF